MASIYARVRAFFRSRNGHYEVANNIDLDPEVPQQDIFRPRTAPSDETANNSEMRLMPDPEVSQEEPDEELNIRKYTSSLEMVYCDFNWKSVHRSASRPLQIQDILDDSHHEAECKSLVCIPKKLLEGDIRFEKNECWFTDTTGNTAFHVLIKIGVRLCRQNGKKSIDEDALLKFADRLKLLNVDLYQPDSNGMTVKKYATMFKENWLLNWLNDEGITDKVRGKHLFERISYYSTLINTIPTEEQLFRDFLQNTIEILPEDLIDSDSVENSSCNLFQISVLKPFSSIISDLLLEKNIGSDLSIRKFGSFHYYVFAKYPLKFPVSYLKYLRDQNIHPPVDVLFVFFENLKNLQTKINEKNEHSSLFLQKMNASFQVITYYLFEYKENEIKDLVGDILSYQCPITRDSVLHLAIQLSNDSIIKYLIKLGVSVGAHFLEIKNLRNKKPIDLLECHVIEELLDNCISVKSKSSAVNENFKAEVNYSSWLPAVLKNNNSDKFESEFIAQFVNENNRKLSTFLNHPVIIIFVLAKWYKTCIFFFLDLFYYVMFYIVTLLYYCEINIIPSDLFASPDNSLASSNLPSIVLYHGIAIGVNIVRLRLRLQIYGVLGMVKQIDGLIEIIILILYLLEMFQCKWFWSLNVLLLSINFFFILGQLPCLALKTVMYRKVSETFFKNMAFYVILILPFVVYFTLSVNNSKDTPNGQTESAFNITYHTFLWFAGGDIKEEIHGYSVLARFISVLFILLIPVILENLLLCLTLNDMTKISKEAVHLENKERTTYVYHLNKVFRTLRLYYKKFHCKFLQNIGFKEWDPSVNCLLISDPKILLRGTEEGNIKIVVENINLPFHNLLRACNFYCNQLPPNVQKDIISILERNANPSVRPLN